MKRWAVICILLCVVFSGCKSDEPVPPPEETPVPEGPALDTVTYLPEDLLDELESYFQFNDEAIFEQMQTLDIAQKLREEEVTILAPEILESDVVSMVQGGVYWTVDFNNDGTNDIFAYYRVGSGIWGVFWDVFFLGDPDGGFDMIYYSELCVATPFFIQWNGQNYYVVVQRDEYYINGELWHGIAGFNVACFDEDGQIQEQALLRRDPETGELTRDVYTLGVNTEFPLPTH